MLRDRRIFMGKSFGMHYRRENTFLETIRIHWASFVLLLPITLACIGVFALLVLGRNDFGLETWLGRYFIHIGSVFLDAGGDAYSEEMGLC